MDPDGPRGVPAACRGRLEMGRLDTAVHTFTLVLGEAGALV
jgi:hypothetical protein